MQAWVFYSCQAFTSLEMHPPAFRHANAYDQGTAYGTNSLEGGAIAAYTFTLEHPAATDRDGPSRR